VTLDGTVRGNRAQLWRWHDALDLPPPKSWLWNWRDAFGPPPGASRPILPPMPWPMYRNMTDDDLKAMYAYLRTIPPVTNHVPDAVVATPAPSQQ